MANDWEQLLNCLSAESRRASRRTVPHPLTIEPGWYIIVVHEQEIDPELRRCSSRADMIAKLRAITGTCWALPVFGVPASYVEVGDGPGSQRYLRLPDGSLEPLFDADTPLRPAESYYLGPPPPDKDFDPTTIDFNKALSDNKDAAADPGEFDPQVEENWDTDTMDYPAG